MDQTPDWFPSLLSTDWVDAVPSDPVLLSVEGGGSLEVVFSGGGGSLLVSSLLSGTSGSEVAGSLELLSLELLSLGGGGTSLDAELLELELELLLLELELLLLLEELLLELELELLGLTGPTGVLAACSRAVSMAA